MYVTLENIRGVKKLVFPFPEKKGVYVLTGTNGCGKTSLMIALNRIGNGWAFKAFPILKHGLGVDPFKNATITYGIDENHKVSYIHRQQRWVPSPYTRHNIFAQFPFCRTEFVSANGKLFTQPKKLDKKSKLKDAAKETKDAMNEILDTTRFSNLQYYAVGQKKGRKTTYYRSDKLYIIKDGNHTYSESNFSLGENLLLNTLDALENVHDNTLLLIDEVELALHPVAQSKLYEYLEKQADDKNLAIILSTHSATLIRQAKHCIYLEKETDGQVEVLNNCFPAYILKQVGSAAERHCDFYFFVEDDMAERYVRTVLHRFFKDNNINYIYSVEPVGGYDSVMRFVQNIETMGIPKKKAQAILDADAQESYQWLLDKGNDRMEGDNRKLALFQNNQSNITYLSITPELGVWQWIEQNKKTFKSYYESEHRGCVYDIEDCINQTSTEESNTRKNATTQGRLRNWAKGCFRNFKERVHKLDNMITEDAVINDMMECYVKNTYNKADVEPIIKSLINRR